MSAFHRHATKARPAGEPAGPSPAVRARGGTDARLGAILHRRAEAPPAGAESLERAAQGELPAGVGETLCSSGVPLDAGLREDMAQRFGVDFSPVRLHADAGAAESARGLDAQAYTVGHHIAFASGRFAPATRAGRHLIAHELTHVLQQSGLAGLRPAPSGAGLATLAAPRWPYLARQVTDTPGNRVPALARTVPEIDLEIEVTRLSLEDDRRLAQDWIEQTTKKPLPMPNPVPPPDRPKQTRTPRAGSVPSRVGTIKTALEGIAADGGLPADVRHEAERRLGRIGDFERSLESLHRERAGVIALHTAPPKAPAQLPAKAPGGSGPTVTPAKEVVGKGTPATVPARKVEDSGALPKTRAPTPAPVPFGQQIKATLSHAGFLLLLDFISAYIMSKIESSLLEKDWRAQLPQIEAAIAAREADVVTLLKTRKRIYANIRMDVMKNWVPNHNWQNPGGDWRYFKTQLLGVALSTEDINRTDRDQASVETIALQLWAHHPFTYSVALADPKMVEDMPVGFDGVMRQITSVLEDVSRRISVAGPRFTEINQHLHVALQQFGVAVWTTDDPWASMMRPEAERLLKLKGAVARTLAAMQKTFGATPTQDENQLMANMWVARWQIDSLEQAWPMTFDLVPQRLTGR